MISIEEAVQIINDNLPSPNIEEILLKDSIGYVLAENILSPVNMPGFTNSAMDGFAVKWAEVKDSVNSSVRLRIIGESAAGAAFNGTSGNDTAVRINTGAKVPADYDTVIPVEDTAVNGSYVIINSVKKKNQNIRYEGEEYKSGDILLTKDTILNPPELALLASSGIIKIKVYKSPGISIIVTGKELVSFDEEVKDAQVRDSNGIMLSSLISRTNAEVNEIIRVHDSLKDTVSAIQKAESISDIIVLSGGVSVGLHDHVKDAAEENGFERLFWKVNQKPGKPFYAAKKEGKLLFGLPGNPVSAMVCFVYYVYPVIQKLSGKKIDLNKIKVFSTEKIVNKQNRCHFKRAKIIRDGNLPLIKISDKQASHMITSLTESDGLVLLKPGEEIEENTELNFYLFPWRHKWVL